MERLNGLYNTECNRTAAFYTNPDRTCTDIKFATDGWAVWYNNRRLQISLPAPQ